MLVVGYLTPGCMDIRGKEEEEEGQERDGGAQEYESGKREGA